MSVRQVVGNGARMVGSAVTGRIVARGEGDGLALADLVEVIDTVPRPRVVVLEDADDPPGCGSLLGEVTGTYFKALGCVGFATNGGVRDLPDLERIGLVVFGGGACVSHGYVRLTSVGEPVTIGGLSVQTGDLLHGDEHGVLSIPLEIAADLAEVADQVRGSEQETIRWAHSAEFSAQALIERRRKVGH
jgi:regulator of RNase E activity RraA